MFSILVEVSQLVQFQINELNITILQFAVKGNF